MDPDKHEAKSLAKALIEALDMRNSLVKSGMVAAEADRIVGQALQAEWGSGREATYRCWKCRDTGYVFAEDKTKLYGPKQSTILRAARCGPGCAFVIYERKKRQDALGTFGSDPFVSAGQTRRRG